MKYYNNEVVKCTVIYNYLKIQNNWHHALILNNTNKNLRMILHHGDFVTIDWNELGLLDQQFNLLHNDIMHGNLSFPTHLNFFSVSLGYGKHSRRQKGISCAQNQSWVCHISTNGRLAQTNIYVYIYMLSLHWPPSPWLNLDPNW